MCDKCVTKEGDTGTAFLCTNLCTISKAISSVSQRIVLFHVYNCFGDTIAVYIEVSVILDEREGSCAGT